VGNRRLRLECVCQSFLRKGVCVRAYTTERLMRDLMDRLQAMQVFTRIVEMNSFSRAADSLHLPKASATTIIKNLEAHLHVRLMHRTTRRLKLTPEGAEYYERCVRILGEIEEAEGSLSATGRGPRGKLKIDMTASIGKMIVMPHLSAFSDRYPDIELTVGFGDKPVDLVQEGVDCAIWIGALEDSSFVARKLGEFPVITAASPEYIARYGEPTSIEELYKHTAIHYFSSKTGRAFDVLFVDGSKTTKLRMPGAIAVNDAEAYISCGLKGVGLIQSPRFMVVPYLRSGVLVEVLARWRPPAMSISAIYPDKRYVAPKVRVFIEWAATLFETCPLLYDSRLHNDSCRASSSALRSREREGI
jgi:LysR family transcriptional regulator for bpeEF and oprC